jgi:hypothetical protein
LNDSKYFGSAHSLLGGNIHFNKLMNGTDSCASGRSLISKSIKEGLSVYYETECQGIDVTNAAAIVPKSPTAAPTNSSSVNPVVSAPVAQEPSKILIGYTLAGRKVYEIVQSNIFRRAYGAKLIYDQEVSGMTEIQWSWLNDPRFEKKKAAKIAEFIERVKLLEVQYPGYTKAALSNPTMIDSIRGQVWDEILAEGSYEFLNSMGFKMATSSNYNETISTQPQIKGYWNPVKETIICADAMPTYNNDYSTTCAIGAAKKQYSGGYANDLIPDQKKCIDQGLKYFSVILELKCIPDLTVAN